MTHSNLIMPLLRKGNNARAFISKGFLTLFLTSTLSEALLILAMCDACSVPFWTLWISFRWYETFLYLAKMK